MISRVHLLSTPKLRLYYASKQACVPPRGRENYNSEYTILVVVGLARSTKTTNQRRTYTRRVSRGYPLD
jgi:hypothetical protein